MACGCITPTPNCSCNTYRTGYSGMPNFSVGRYADPVTMDHIIELRKEILRLEKVIEDLKRELKK